MKGIPIIQLQPGTAFSLMTGKRGVVEYHGPGSTSVKYDARKVTSFTTAGGEHVHFEIPERAVISSNTEVILLYDH